MNSITFLLNGAKADAQREARSYYTKCIRAAPSDLLDENDDGQLVQASVPVAGEINTAETDAEKHSVSQPTMPELDESPGLATGC